MIIPRIIAALLLSFFVSSSVLADEAFDFFIEACRHSGYNPAEISTFQAVFHEVQKTALPVPVVESLIKRNRENVANVVTWSEEKWQEYEGFLKSLHEDLSGGMSTSINKVLVRNSASLVGLADTHAHILIENQTDQRSSFFCQGSGGQLSAIQFGERRVGIEAVASEPAMYHLLGRIGTPSVRRYMKILLSDEGDGGFDITGAGIADFKKDCEVHQRTFTLSDEKVKYEENREASILEINEKDWKERFWIDSDRGYICPKVQIFSINAESGAEILYSETILEGFVLDEQSQKWFPAKTVRVFGMSQEAPTGKPEHSIEMSVVPGTLVLNMSIPDTVFAVSVPLGGRVNDFRRDDNSTITFISDEPGELDLSSLMEKSLDDIGWLSQQEVNQYNPPPIKKASFSWTRIVLLSAGIILITLGLILRFAGK